MDSTENASRNIIVLFILKTNRTAKINKPLWGAALMGLESLPSRVWSAPGILELLPGFWSKM